MSAITSSLFSWTDFLSRDPNFISHDEWECAFHQSREWPTCACGDLCKCLPRDQNGAPIDGHLNWLGREFHCAIGHRFISSARETFEKIEARSAFLIQHQRREEQQERRKRFIGQVIAVT